MLEKGFYCSHHLALLLLIEYGAGGGGRAAKNQITLLPRKAHYHVCFQLISAFSRASGPLDDGGGFLIFVYEMVSFLDANTLQDGQDLHFSYI